MMCIINALVLLLMFQAVVEGKATAFEASHDQKQTANKEFWDRLYHNAFSNTKTKYDVLNGDRICLTCPIDRAMYNNLYHEVSDAFGTPVGDYPPRVSITWVSQLPNDFTIFYCRNSSRVTQSPQMQNYDTDGYSEQQRRRGSGEVDFSCENNQLCLNNVRYHYPDSYQCLIRSYAQSVKLNVIVELQSLLLYFGGDSVKFDFQKEVQVFENQVFTVKCEVPETNPVSTVSAYIDNVKLKLTDLRKKPIENRMTINTYLYEVNATRAMNGKRIKCEAQMENLPVEFASLIELRSYISKEYTLSVYYLPTCLYADRVYKTGINRSLTIECPINGSNPDVTYYKIIPPSPRTKFEQIDTDLETLRHIGRYRINPASQADFGVYQCIPRSLSGTAQCDIHVELGATPNPPEYCQVQFNKVNNKTFAQFSCRPGFNQGGSTSFLTIYEQTLPDKQLKLSGRVNIDESKGDKEVPYITPADENSYYEFVIIQENNYGNSTPVLITLGTPDEMRAATFWDNKSTFVVAGAIAVAIFVLCACACCCCSDVLSKSSCSKCTQSDEEDGPTYKKGVETYPSPFTYNDLSKDSMNAGNQQLLGSSGYYDNPDKDLHATLYKGRNLKSSIYKNSDELLDEDKYEDEDESADDDYKKKAAAEYRSMSRKPYYDDDDYDEDQTSSNGGGKAADGDQESLTEKSGSEDNQVYVHTTTSIKQQSEYRQNGTLRKNYAVQQVKAQGGYRPVPAYGGAGNHYSTIDPKSLKLIQTKNGLVYTPKSGGGSGMGTPRNKSNDALLYHDDEDEQQTRRKASNDYEGIYDNKTLSSAIRSAAAVDGGRGTLKRREQDPNENFKIELTQKLKSMSDSKPPANAVLEQVNGRGGGNKPPSTGVVYKPIMLAQPEHFSNTTATTSISSPSSCASSSDLAAKESDSNGTKTAEPINGTGNKNYSLLKTTLNPAKLMTETETAKSGPVKQTDTLGRAKPAITKPKPRIDTAPKPRPPLNTTTGSSVHDQSTDALIKPGVKEASEHTSPSTSVTDVSSTNCTPQHGGGGVGSADENGQFIPSSNSTSSTSSSTKQISRSRSNSLTRPSRHDTHKPAAQSQSQTNAAQFKTFSQEANPYGGVYSTLSRTNKPASVKTIDDEISMISRAAATRPPGHRTLERRHVKNSEC